MLMIAHCNITFCLCILVCIVATLTATFLALCECVRVCVSVCVCVCVFFCVCVCLWQSKLSTSRVCVWQMGIPCSYTMESTYNGPDQGPYKGNQVLPQHLEEMGRVFADVLPEFAARAQAM